MLLSRNIKQTIIWTFLLIVIYSFIEDEAFEKTNISVKLVNGKSINLQTPSIISHKMYLQFSDHTASNDIDVINRYLILAINDTISLKIKTKGTSNSLCTIDRIDVKAIEQKLRTDYALSDSFSSKKSKKNGLELLEVYYNYGCNITGCSDGVYFSIDLHHNRKDEKKIKSIVETLSILNH
jgi:hypothetical protein